jgi:hypothetical protein
LGQLLINNHIIDVIEGAVGAMHAGSERTVRRKDKEPAFGRRIRSVTAAARRLRGLQGATILSHH